MLWIDPLGLKRKRGRGNTDGTFTDSNGTLRNSDGTFASGESDSASRGRTAHKNYELTLGGGYDFNRGIPGSNGTLRPDAINFEENIVRELKPDTPSGRCKGNRQLQGYLDYLNEYFPCDNGWTGFLDTYSP